MIVWDVVHIGFFFFKQFYLQDDHLHYLQY